MSTRTITKKVNIIFALEESEKEFVKCTPSSINRDLFDALVKTYSNVRKKCKELRAMSEWVNPHTQWFGEAKKDYEEARVMVGIAEKEECDKGRKIIGEALCRKDADGKPFLKEGKFIFTDENAKIYAQSIQDFQDSDVAMAYETVLSHFEESEVAIEYRRAKKDYEEEAARINKEQNEWYNNSNETFEAVTMPASFVLPSVLNYGQKIILVDLGIISE